MQPVFEIVKRLDRMESEFRKFKQTVGSSMEHKIHELRTNIVSALDKMIAEKTYASAVEGQNQSNHRAAMECYNHTEVYHNSKHSVKNNYVGTSHQTKDSLTILPVYDVYRSAQTFVKTVYVPHQDSTEQNKEPEGHNQEKHVNFQSLPL